MAAILRLTITADIKGYCPIGHLRTSARTSVISDVALLGHPSSMLWSIDTCQNKVSADQYHVTILRAQVESSSRSAVFFSSWPLTRYWFPIGSQAQAQPKRGSTRFPLHQVNIFTVLYGRRYSCLGGIRFWKKPLFPAFSAVLIENRLDIIVYGFAREKIVWFGKVLIMQALSSDVAVY